MGGDQRGKLPAAFLQPTHSESRELRYSKAFLLSHHRCCHSERTTSAGWKYRKLAFPRECSRAISASGEVPLCVICSRSLWEITYNLKRKGKKAMSDPRSAACGSFKKNMNGEYQLMMSV